VPSLGIAGSLLKDFARNNHATIGGLASGVESGFPCVSTRLGGASSTMASVPITGNSAVSMSVFAKVDTTSFSALASIGSSSSANSGFGLATQSGGIRIDFYSNSYVSGSGLFTTGRWVHFAGTKSPGAIASTSSLYVNGLLVSGSGDTTTPNFAGGLLYFGDLGFNPGVFRGTVALDDLRVYNRALTAAEIRLLASRRGIGLQPLPDRAAGLPRKLSVNVGGTWRPADAYVHDGTAFRLSEAKINVGGVWK
jgi:hypothetical protein